MRPTSIIYRPAWTRVLLHHLCTCDLGCIVPGAGVFKGVFIIQEGALFSSSIAMLHSWLVCVHCNGAVQQGTFLVGPSAPWLLEPWLLWCMPAWLCRHCDAAAHALPGHQAPAST